MFNLFSRNKQVVTPTRKKKSKRSFMGAKPSAMHKFNADYSKINNELKSDGIALVLRARSLVKNNSVAASFVQMMIRNIIGSNGFRLEVTSYNQDGSPDVLANKIIQDYWYEYTKMGNYVEITESMTENEFDKQILFSLLVDGECFLRKHRDPTSKFGIRYELIDALDVDNLKNGEFNDGSRVVLGIRVDKHYKPISYFIRENPSPDYYLQGQTVEVPASEIIHIYKRTFPNQVRGYSIFAPAMLNMASLEQYSRSELESAILSATLQGIWVKTGTSDTDYSQYDEDEIDENGDVATQIEPGCLKYAPEGYDLKQLSVNHPNNNYSNFTKHICKSIASALGISYNKMLGDYESVNYSSLRAAALEDNETYRDYQQFLINAWKNVQYYEFLKYLLLTDLTNLPYSKIQKFSVHEFRGKAFHAVDEAKEMAAIKTKLELKLTDPITEIQKLGYDADDVLNNWQRWQQKLKERNLTITNDELTNLLTLDNDEDEVDENGNQL